ncbi:MAG: sugar phosphate isomerase/epimerase [Oscillospiraceae bacterium]|jgi:sugar phosphate isomerase/epimerase|nr:sugar phosphate isomerase/epimerase [Oscillospiraceae bacterium]
MRIGLTTGMYYSVMETEEALSYIGRFGVPCCEVFFETFSEYSTAFARELVSRLNGIEPVSMHTRTQHFETDLLGSSKRQRADGIDNFARALDAGAELGVKLYVYHGPMQIRGERKPIEKWRGALEYAAEMAAKRGIQLCWENVSWCALSDPERVEEAAEVCPRLGFVMDVKQAMQTRRDPLEYVKAMGKRLRHVHVLDKDEQGRPVLPGRGVYDFRRLADTLREMDYGGDVILEPYNELTRDEDALRSSLDYLRDIFE